VGTNCWGVVVEFGTFLNGSDYIESPDPTPSAYPGAIIWELYALYLDFYYYGINGAA
jgi:hypothetical protein